MPMSLTKIKKMFRARPAGKEKPMDTTPIAMPMGAMHPTPLADLIARMVKQAVEQEKQEEFETMEESDDFEMDDDDLLDLSPYEFNELTDEFPLSELERSEAEPENLAEAERKPSSDNNDPPPEVEPEQAQNTG